MLKTRQQARNGVTYIKPHVIKPRLNYSFAFPRYGMLNQSIRNHLICLTDPCHALKVSDFALTNLLFASVTSLFPLSPACKSLSFYTAPLRSFLSARLDAAQFKSVLLKLLTFLIKLSLSLNKYNCKPTRF